MLEIKNLRAGYGAINVLWDVTLQVPEARLTAVIGPNGAGKTTLLRAMMGLIAVTQGEIRFNGKSLREAQTWEIARSGVSMIPEGRMIFRDMTVEENLVLGAFPKASRWRIKENMDRVYGYFQRLKERRAQIADSLSGGEAQMLAMGRGLMSEPQLILVDEPSLGLAPMIVEEMFSILARLRADGRTVVLVEQNTHKAVGIADQVYLLQTGRVVYSERAAEVDLGRLHDLYFSR